MPSSRIQGLIDRSVERFEYLFDCYPEVVVSMSGGKDSTVAMEVGAIAARRRGRRLAVHFYDEEVIPQHTEDYIRRIASRDPAEGINLTWYCVPIRDLNGWAAAEGHPYWYPWAPEARDVWARPMPSGPSVVTEHPHLPANPPEKRVGIPDSSKLIATKVGLGRFCIVLGLRASESPARQKSSRDWLSIESRASPAAIARPITDWSTPEVWQAIAECGWDWNRYYLAMWRVGLSHWKTDMRVGPLLGEQSSRVLPYIRMIDPALFAAICRRVPGGEALARYAKTAVMGRGRIKGEVTVAMIMRAVDRLPAEKQPRLRELIRVALSAAIRAGIEPPLAEIYKASIRGDTRGARSEIAIASDILMKARKKVRFRGGRLERREYEHEIGRLRDARKEKGE